MLRYFTPKLDLAWHGPHTSPSPEHFGGLPLAPKDVE